RWSDWYIDAILVNQWQDRSVSQPPFDAFVLSDGTWYRLPLSFDPSSLPDWQLRFARIETLNTYLITPAHETHMEYEVGYRVRANGPLNIGIGIRWTGADKINDMRVVAHMGLGPW